MKLTANLDKIGITGLFLTDLAIPCCFPLFAFVLSAFEPDSAEIFGSWTEYIFEGLILVSLVGFFFAYKQHQNIFPFLTGLLSGGLILYAYNFNFNSHTIYYTGMSGLLIATGLN